MINAQYSIDLETILKATGAVSAFLVLGYGKNAQIAAVSGDNINPITPSRIKKNPNVYEIDLKKTGSIILVFNRKLTAEKKSLLESQSLVYSRLMLKTLEIADNAAYLSFAGHEIKNPLTPVLGYIQLLQLRLKEKAEIKYVEPLAKDAQRVLYLLDKLLRANRIRTDREEYFFEEASLLPLIDEEVARAGKLNKGHKFDFKNHVKAGQDELIADKAKIRMVLASILENAAKYSKEGSRISVLVKKEKPYLVVQIGDKGLGIPGGRVKAVFEGFKKGKGSNDPGLGLSLYIAKAVIEKHSGKILVAPNGKAGTVVTIKLPSLKK